MAVRAWAKRREREGAGGLEQEEVEWIGMEWSGVKGECRMGSVSCIFWLKAQGAASNQLKVSVQTSDHQVSIADGW